MNKTKMSLRIFAHQIANLMTQPSDGKPTTYCPCDSVRAVVKVTKAKGMPIWIDQCSMDGEGVGNRYGLIKEFTQMVIDANPEIVTKEID